VLTVTAVIAAVRSELLCGSSSAAACHEALDLRILGKLTERLNALINLRNIRSVLAWRRGVPLPVQSR